MTDLSPLPICQGSTDPLAIRSLLRGVGECELFHLPRLHAKVFVADSRHAIVTSANLTAGGLKANLEYGVELNDGGDSQIARRDLAEYTTLAASISRDQLDDYIAVADEVRSRFEAHRNSASQEARRAFADVLRNADDELIRLRLARGPMTAVFAATILYVLRADGPLATPELHRRVEAIHPDLCDNSVDRVIDGRRFGRKWKHAVRSAQQHLKSRAQIALRDGRWALVGGDA